MQEEGGADEECATAGQECPAGLASQKYKPESGKAESGKQEPAGGDGAEGGKAESEKAESEKRYLTIGEREAVHRFLEDGDGMGMSRGKSAVVWAALRVVAFLLATGVAIAVGDGNEFDGVDCGVAAKPPGWRKAESGKSKSENGDPASPGGYGAAGPPELSYSVAGAASVLMDVPLHCLAVLADGQRAVVKTVEAAMQRFEGKLDAVASGNLQLLKENGELRALHRDGFFKFALRVDPEDFRAFAAIMALGNRKAAAEVLEVAARTFYDRVTKWNLRGVEYQRMARLVGWRKRVGRRIKLRLEDSVQSGEPNDLAENPVTVEAVLESIATADNRDYPTILRQVMETLEAQNVTNWPSVRNELVEMIKEEI